MQTKYIIALILFVLFLIFIIQNTVSVTVKFLIFEATMPQAILLFITLAAGVVIGVFLPYRFKKERK
ncbi:MAG: LapA family protein, partial [Calditrichaceae bacterium]|nr:LapA family protein [Calditrichaceae bacterium]